MHRLSELLLALTDFSRSTVLTELRPSAHTLVPSGFINDHHSPHSSHHIQKQQFIRNGSDTSFNFSPTMPPPPMQGTPRAASEVMQPQPVPVSALPGRSRVAWNLGSED